MKRQIKKVVGVLVLIAVLFTSIGHEVQAAKQIKWPYGTYVCNNKKLSGGKAMISWEYSSEPTEKYPESIIIWFPKSTETSADSYNDGDLILFKKKGTNKYISRIYMMREYTFDYEIKVSKNSLKIREGSDVKGIARFFPGRKWYTFKLKKRMSKNVG